MVYWCHIWAGVVQSSFSRLDRVQKRVVDELFSILQSIFHRRNVAISMESVEANYIP